MQFGRVVSGFAGRFVVLEGVSVGLNDSSEGGDEVSEVGGCTMVERGGG